MAFVTELMGDRCSLTDADIIEIGSSAHQPFGNGAVAWANGARSVRAMDFQDLINPERVGVALYELFADILARPEHWKFNGEPERDFVERVREVPFGDLEEGRLDVLHGEGKPFRYFNYEDSKKSFEENSADILMSTSVYEHIREPLEELSWHRALLRPGGYAMHTIDFRDHRSYVFEGFHPWSFMIDGGYGAGSDTAGVRHDHWINGLRLSQLLEVVREAGFEIIDVRRDVVETPTEKHQSMFRPEFQELSEEDRDTLAIRLLARAPG